MTAARSAIAAIWSLMVEMAEANHDLIVLAQRRPTLRQAGAVRQRAEDLAVLARAAELLARSERPKQ